MILAWTCLSVVDKVVMGLGIWWRNAPVLQQGSKIADDGSLRKKTLYSFPKEPAMQKKWIAKTFLENLVVKPLSRLCQDHFEEDQFERGQKFLKSLNMEHMKPVLRADAIPTVFNKDAPKGGGQVKGKVAFKRNQFNSKFCSKFEGSSSPVSSSSPRKQSPRRKRFGAYAKRRRLEASI